MAEDTQMVDAQSSNLQSHLSVIMLYSDSDVTTVQVKSNVVVIV